MRKRVLSILGACLVLASVLALFVVPVGAVSDSDGAVVYSPIFFDTVSFGRNGVKNDWVFNYTQDGTSYASFLVGEDDSGYGGYVSVNSNKVSGVFYHGADFDLFGLVSSEPQVVALSDLSTFVIGNDMDDLNIKFQTVSISCSVLVPEFLDSNSSYTLKKQNLYTVYTFDDVSEIALGNMISQLVSLYASSGKVLISNISISVEYYLSDPIGSRALEVKYVGVNSRPDFQSWFYDQDFKSVIVTEWDTFDFEWLKKSISAFFEFEIAPGFSFNNVVMLVMGIVVFFFLLKMVS